MPLYSIPSFRAFGISGFRDRFRQATFHPFAFRVMGRAQTSSAAAFLS